MNKTKVLLAIIFILLAVIAILLSRKQVVQKTDMKQQKNISDSIIGTFSHIEDFTEGYEMLSGIEPQEGFIPDYKTAIKYAELIWYPIYGEKIYKENPFNAYLVSDSIWIISGTLSKNTKGGTIEAIIRKSDGKVLRVVHQK